MSALETYIEKNKNSDLFPILFQKIIDEGKLKTFEEIVSINPYYKIIDFDSDFFSDKFVQTYSVKNLLLLKNRIDENLLEYGLENEQIKKKIIFFLQILPLLLL